MQMQKLLYASTNGYPTGLVNFLGISLMTAPGKIVEWSPRENSLPMVTIGARPIFNEATNALAAIFAPGFDPRAEVILPMEAQSSITVTNQTQARIISRHHTAARIDLEIMAEQPSLVVAAQSFYNSWKATVDGRTVPLWRANFAFQALEVPAGQHQVRLVYPDCRFYLGAVISVGALCFCLVNFFRKSRS